MKNTRNLLTILVAALVLSSCVREYKENPNERKVGQNQARNSGIAKNKQPVAQANQNQRTTNLQSNGIQKSIDNSGNYYVELKSALGLTKTKMEKVKVVLEKFRPKLKAANKQDKNKAIQIKRNRNNALAVILSPAEMEKKSYFDSVFYGFKTDNPTNFVNVKNTLGLTDQQVFDWIEVQSKFKQQKKGKSMDEITQLLGDKNTKLQEIFSADQFSDYLTLMRKTYKKG